MQISHFNRQTGSQARVQRKIIKAVLSGRCVRVLGARYSGKSQLLKEVADQVKREFTPFVSYQTLEDLKKDGWPKFYSQLYLEIEKDVLPGRVAPEELLCATPLDLQKRLSDLLEKCDQNLVIFIDDLEIAPPNLIASLLGVIRALYMVSFSRPGAHFQAVVCGSLSFNQLALPYVSRFESVSELVMVGDLDEDESRDMVREFCVQSWVQENEEGVRRFLEYTGGDRYLIRQMMKFIPEVLARSDQSSLAPSVVDGAASELLRHVMELGTGEVIRKIETDPDLLSCVLKVLEQGRVPLRLLPLPSLEIPNILDLIGVFNLAGQEYGIKCRLWRRILAERLTPDRVGRLFALAGKWEQAIDYLGQAHLSQKGEVKLDLFNATINYLHASPNGETAFLRLARGLKLLYPDCEFRLYQRTAASLVPVFPDEAAGQEIVLRGNLQPEVEALHGPDYTVIFDPASPRVLFPLRVRSDSKALGMVAFSSGFNRYLNSQHEEEVYQLIGFLQQAANAIDKRNADAHTLLDAESRAEKQKNLNRILTRILHDHNLPRETIFRLLMAGVTSGFCLEFNRAILFTLDEKSQALVAQIGVGHISRLDADQDWKEFPYKTLDALIEALLVPDYQYTKLHEKVYGKSIPASPKATNLFARALEDQEPKISRGQLMLEGLPQNLVETIGSTPSFALVPFKASSYLTGVLYIDNRFTLHEIGQERIFLLRDFMNQAALVMQLSRALAEEKRRGGILTELLQAEEAINDQITRQVGDVYDQIAESARLLFKASSTVLNTLKRQTEDDITIFHTDQTVYKGTLKKGYEKLSRSDRGFIRHVIQQGFVHIADIDQDDDSSELADMRRSTFVKAENVHATVGIRLGPADKPEGVLHINWDAPHPLTAEERALITIFASYAAVTIPSARRYAQVQEDLRYRTREMEGLSQLLHAGTERWSEEEINKIIQQALITTTDLTGINDLLLIRRSPIRNFQYFSLEPDHTISVSQIERIEDRQIASLFIQKIEDGTVIELENGLLWPIQVAGNLLAGLILRTDDRLQQRVKHKEYLDHLCNRLALTFHYSQVYQALNRLFHAALRMTQNIENPDFLDDFMEQLVDEAMESLSSIDTITSYYGKDSSSLKAGPNAGLWFPEAISTASLNDSSVQAEILNADEPIFTEDVRQNTRLMGPFVEREGIISAAAFPLRIGDDRMGSLFFSYRHYQKFDPGERALLNLFTQLAAIAVHHALLKEKAAHRLKSMETVAHITDHLAKSGSDLDSMYRNLFREVLQAVPQADNACIIQKDPEYQQYFIVPASLDFYQVQLQPNQDTLRIAQGTPRGIAIRVIESGQPALSGNAPRDPDYYAAIPTTCSEICVPIELEGRPHAAILLESNRLNAFNQDDLLLLTALAPVISIAIQRVQQMLHQREREELENMSNFAALMVHEFAKAIANIPDVIKEVTESIQNGEPIDEECVIDLLHSSEQAKQLTTYVRDISHVGFYNPLIEALEPVILEAIEQAKTKAPEHIRLTFHPDCPLPPFAFDRRLILILIKNILENALPAIPADREGRVEISSILLTGEVILHIHDNGTGIPENDQPAIFERPFSTKKDQTQMHGFGLWLSKRIVSLHRGDISFTSGPDTGTTFTVRLPLNTPQERL